MDENGVSGVSGGSGGKNRVKSLIRKSENDFFGFSFLCLRFFPIFASTASIASIFYLYYSLLLF